VKIITSPARNGQARFFTLAQPVAFLLIFATVFRGGGHGAGGGRHEDGRRRGRRLGEGDHVARTRAGCGDRWPAQMTSFFW
jgi:hypothetical protein